MKQITIDECVGKSENRFELVRLISQRAKQLTRGHRRLVEATTEKNILASMREVTNGKVFFVKNEEDK